MFFELIAAVTAGVGAGGVALLMRRLSGGRLPRAAIPVAAGAAMIGFAVWSEYSWAGRTLAGLPEGFQQISSFESRSPLRPWSYAVPLTEGVIVADIGGIRRHKEATHLALVDVYVFRRWLPASRRTQIVDCDGQRRADVMDAADLSPGHDRDWVAPGPADATLQATCGP